MITAAIRTPPSMKNENAKAGFIFEEIFSVWDAYLRAPNDIYTYIYTYIYCLGSPP